MSKNKLRSLKAGDLYPMSKILKKMGIKIDASDGKTQQQVGAEFIITVFENIHLAEKEVNEFLGSLISLTADEFAELPFDEIIEVIKEFKQLPGILSFFKQADQ